MNPTYRFYQIVLLLLICLANVSGQEYYNIPLSSAKYFDNHITYSAALDTNANLWVGTEKGLYKFDGGQSINASELLENWESLGNAFIKKIHCDQNNRLWINTMSQGIAVIDLNTRTTKRIELINKNGKKISDYGVQSLIIDESYAWISLWKSADLDGGILQINLNTYQTDITTLKDIIVPGKLHQDIKDDNTLWITGESLSRFNKTTKTYQEIEYDSTINAEHLITITENNRNQLYIVFRDAINNNRSNRIITYDKSTGKWIQDNPLESLDYSINYTTMYNDSLLLISTGDNIQLAMYDTYNKSFIDWPFKKELLRNEGSLQRLENGELIISGYNTNYLKIIKPAYGTIPISNFTNNEDSYYGTGHFINEKYIFPKLGTNNYLLELDTSNWNVSQKIIDQSYNYRAIYKIEKNKSLAVARDAITIIDHTTSKVTTLQTIDEYLPSVKSSKMYYNSSADLQGNVWVSTSHHSIIKYDISTGKLLNYELPKSNDENEIFVFDVTADEDGNIYAAGRYEIFYKGINQDKFSRLLDEYPQLEMPNNMIPYCIASTNRNEILLGTWAKGTYKINTSSNEVIRIGPKINNVYIQSIRPLKDNKYALFTKTYVALYNSLNDEYKLLRKKDGILEPTLRNPSVFTKNRHDYISFDSEFRSFNVDSLLSGQNQDITVSKISVNGKNKLINTDINLSHNENNIIINYALSEYDVYNQVRYKYKLFPLDSDWIEVQNRKELMFSNLNPDTYTLSIQSTNVDGFWINNTTDIQFNINPPWYSTWWSKLLGALLLLIILYGIVRNYIVTQKQNLENEKRFAQLETMILKSQMNPHFIFNSLNSIRYLFMKDQKDKGLKYITKFAKLLRSTLHHGEHALVKLSEEIELTELFIELEQLRFEDKFEYIANFDPSNKWKEINIPPFVIQPLVENAFWHGLSQSTKEVKQLKIEIEQVAKSWVIHVTDNGIGMGQSKSTIDSEVGKKKSYGLSLIQERFDLINTTQKNKYQIDTHATESESGTRMTITITT